MNNPRWLIILCLVVLVSIIAATGCVRIVRTLQVSSALVSDATLSTDIDSQSKPVNAQIPSPSPRIKYTFHSS